MSKSKKIKTKYNHFVFNFLKYHSIVYKNNLNNRMFLYKKND